MVKRLFPFLLLLALAIPFTVLAAPRAWPKDGGKSCNLVFAKIQNDSQSTLSWNGFVKANGSTVATGGGSVATGEWAEVSWPPPSGFSGGVEAYVEILNDAGSVVDSHQKTGELNCPAPTSTSTEVVPTETETATPSATPTVIETSTEPSATPTVTESPTEGPSPSPTNTQEEKPQSSPTPQPGPKTGGEGPSGSANIAWPVFLIGVTTVCGVCLVAMFRRKASLR